MAQLWKRTKRSPLEWVSLIRSEGFVASSRIPTFNCRDALSGTKISYFHTGRGLLSEKSSFAKWVSPISWKDEFLSPKPLYFQYGTPFSSVKIPSVRGFCTERSPKDQQSLFIKWASSISLKDQIISLKSPCLQCGSTVSLVKFSSLRGFCTETTRKDSPYFRSPRILSEAQSALIDYLHSTTGLDFADAEHLSRNSPIFIGKLLKKVENVEHTGRAVSRFLRYHPINEFELFFESMGLRPSEFNPFLPRNLMFLKDDEELLENYHVLCNYGIARGRIGKIYKEAAEVFRYGFGILSLKLKAYEGLGLSKATVVKIVTSSPALLVGDTSKEFVKLLEQLEDIGIQRNWVGGALSATQSYNWGRMLTVLKFFNEMGFPKEELGSFVETHPDFLLDGSGKMMFSLVGFLTKVGTPRNKVFSLLTRFPHVQSVSFMKNLREGMLFLIEIKMDPEDIQKLLCTHTEFFGLHTLKKPNSLITSLNIGKQRLCKLIKEDPCTLKKYVRGSKICPLPSSGGYEKSIIQKRDFLLRLGFVEGSKEMEKALKLFRGKGDELQERFDCLVKLGFDPNDVCNMVKTAPPILGQKVDVLERKIDFLLNDLGFPPSSLLAFPQYLQYTIGRAKLRFLMYNWLKDRGKASPSLALSSLIACSDKVFIKKFITRHPQGPEIWESFKKAVSQVD